MKYGPSLNLETQQAELQVQLENTLSKTFCVNVVALGKQAFGEGGLAPLYILLHSLGYLLFGSFGTWRGVAAGVREESLSVNP